MTENIVDISSKETNSDRIRLKEAEQRHVYKHKYGIVELHADSLKCLSSGMYLNDAIVQFYAAYLMNEVCRYDMASKIHVFDTIFHNRLKDTFTEKAVDPIKWKQLNKWFNGVDIFEKHFLIFPVCQEDHWIAIVVCYPSEVGHFEEDSLSPDQSSESKGKQVPGIIVMDSLGIYKQSVTKEVRDFLDFEWRTKSKKIKSFSYHNLDQYHPRLPKQTNAFDCGIFMLAYLKSFIIKPDKFYRYVRKGGKQLDENLSASIHTSLSESSREALKSLIYKVCKTRNYSN